MFGFGKKPAPQVTNAAQGADYWNNKWPKAPIIYTGRQLRTSDKKLGIDVKNFITTNDEVLKAIIKQYGLQKSTVEDTVWAIQKWVVRFLTYTADDTANKCPEFWQFPFETVQSKVGDCEDGAILIASLCTNAGVPMYRLKVAAGNVQAAPTAPTSGHAYCIFLADDDNWKIIDWCYFEDSMLPVAKKPLARAGGQKAAYGEVWFTFNGENSWNQTALAISDRIANDKETSSISTATQINAILEDIDLKYNSKE